MMKSSAALRRLMQDWKEIQANPLHTVVAMPLEHNMFEWHCNIIPDEGVYQGVYLHLIVRVVDSIIYSVVEVPTELSVLSSNFEPASYHSPSKVCICFRVVLTPFSVFSSDFVCLDLLKDYASASYTGWTTAYSVLSILLQLQSKCLITSLFC
jgi:ubiquitin-protein ligase